MENEVYYSIDLLHIAKKLLNSLWLILLAGAAAAMIAFCWSRFFVTPQYQSSVTMYVNNSDKTSATISSSDISAAQNLVNTYSVILRNRTTMERVIERTGSGRSPARLIRMVSAGAVDKTQFLKITVTSDDPFEAAELADAMGAVLTERVNEIIEGSSARLMDTAVASSAQVSPNVGKNTVIGFLAGVVLLAAMVVVFDLMDTVVHSEDDLLKRFDIPVLASVPDLSVSGSGKYGKYYGSRYGYESARKTEEPKPTEAAAPQEDPMQIRPLTEEEKQQ